MSPTNVTPVQAPNVTHVPATSVTTETEPEKTKSKVTDEPEVIDLISDEDEQPQFGSLHFSAINEGETQADDTSNIGQHFLAQDFLQQDVGFQHEEITIRIPSTFNPDYRVVNLSVEESQMWQNLPDEAIAVIVHALDNLGALPDNLEAAHTAIMTGEIPGILYTLSF